MKKGMYIVLCIIMLCSIVVNVSAQQIGDVVGNTLYTDIVAKINGYDIESYNINGYTAVCAEDLRAFGYDVLWDQASRSLKITKLANETITSSFKHQAPASYLLGQKRYDVLYTDIKTYINGVEVTSYNINGRTIIYFNDLAVFGAVGYDNNKREISLTETVSANNGGASGTTLECYSGTNVPTFESVTGVKLGVLSDKGSVKTYELCNWDMFLRREDSKKAYTTLNHDVLSKAASRYYTYLTEEGSFTFIDRVRDDSGTRSKVTWYFAKNGTLIELGLTYDGGYDYTDIYLKIEQ